MNKTCLVFGFLLLTTFIMFTGDTVGAVSVGTDVVFQCGNENYTIDSGSMSFSRIQVNSSWVCFNSTGFNISSSDYINISLKVLSDSIVGASVNDKVLGFNAVTSGGVVWFNISGFESGQSYDVYRDNVLLSSTTSSMGGVVSFSCNVWSDHDFDIFEDSQVLRVTYSFADYGNIQTGWDNSIILLLIVVTIVILTSIVGVFYMIRR